MKKLFILLLVLFSISTLAQENSNFKIRESALIWQKVYDSPFTSEEIIFNLKKNGKVSQLEKTGDVITGTIEDLHIDYKSTGYSIIGIGYINIHTVSSSVLIEIKDGKYRVTLSNLILKRSWSNEDRNSGDSHTLDSHALKKGNKEMKNDFPRKAAPIYDFNFNKIFELKTIEDDDNW